MIQVTRKDTQESIENLIRRFNKKVQQSDILGTLKRLQFYEKPLSKKERRQKAIIRKARKSDKMYKIRLGIR